MTDKAKAAFKREVRERARKEGISYNESRRRILAERKKEAGEGK